MVVSYQGSISTPPCLIKVLILKNAGLDNRIRSNFSPAWIPYDIARPVISRH